MPANNSAHLEFTNEDLETEDFVVRIRNVEHRIPSIDSFGFEQMEAIQKAMDGGELWDAMRSILGGAKPATVKAIMNLPSKHALTVLHSWLNLDTDGGGEPGESEGSAGSSEDTAGQ